MIIYCNGNIFDSPAQVIVNPVNTVGVMGKGLALEFKEKFPDMFVKYKTICGNGSLVPGKLYLWKGAPSEKQVLLFPTKKHWRDHSRIEYIEEGLEKFASKAEKLNIQSIAFPKLGCGYGGLNWEEVQPIMEEYLGKLDIDVYIYVN